MLWLNGQEVKTIGTSFRKFFWNTGLKAAETDDLNCILNDRDYQSHYPHFTLIPFQVIRISNKFKSLRDGRTDKYIISVNHILKHEISKIPINVLVLLSVYKWASGGKAFPSSIRIHNWPIKLVHSLENQPKQLKQLHLKELSVQWLSVALKEIRMSLQHTVACLYLQAEIIDTRKVQ